MNTQEIIELLGKQADEISNNLIPGWGNTMRLAASALTEKEKEVKAWKKIAVDEEQRRLAMMKEYDEALVEKEKELTEIKSKRKRLQDVLNKIGQQTNSYNIDYGHRYNPYQIG